MKRTNLLLLVMVLLCSGALADQARKEKFLSLFQVTAAGVVCSEKSYLIRCYGQTQGNCFERTSPIARECVRSNAEIVPDSLDRSAISMFSELVGKCIEEEVRTEFNLPIDDKQCSH